MLPEFTGPHTKPRDGILRIMQTKAWYGLDPDNGAFNWQMSLENIALTMGVRTSDVDSAITNAFSPGCLSRVSFTDKKGASFDKPLLEALVSDGIKPYIWTVGDPKWQETKFIRSGASAYVERDHLICSPSHKMDALRTIVERMHTSGLSDIVVADDKPSNVESVRQLGIDCAPKGIQIYDYLIKLSDKNADATAFYEWIQLLKKSTGHSPEVILDFDGVTANTDSVLFGPAIDNLLKLISKK